MVSLRKVHLFTSLLLLLFVTGTSFALAIHGTASVARIEANGIFQWSVSVEGTTTSPKIKTFDPFVLVNGPSTSTSISIMNGSISNSVELDYVLRAPSKPGTYMLPVAVVEASGQTATTQQTTIEVVDQGQGTPAPQTQANPNRNGRQPQAAPQQTQRNGNDQAFIEVSSSDRNVFVGERVRVTYRAFFQSARSLQITDLPQGSGYTMETAREIKEFKIERADRNNRAYNSTVIFDQWVTPTHAGTVEVPPLEAQIDVIQQVQRRNDPFSLFNDPFGMFSNPFADQQVVPVKVRSPKVILTVKPLPGGRNINDAWIGNYQASISISPQEVPVHSSSTILLNIRGTSQLKDQPTPEFSVPGSVEAYPPVVKVYGDGDNIRKEIRYPVIPRAPGKFALTFQSVTAFDPATQKYQKLFADTVWLTASGSAGGLMTAYVPNQPNTISHNEQLPLPTIERTDTPIQELKMGWYVTSGMILAGLAGLGLMRYRTDRTTVERTKHRGIKKKLFDKISGFQVGNEKISEDIEHILCEYLTLTYKSNEKITHPEHLEKLNDPTATKWMEQWQTLRDLRYQPAAIVESLVAEWKKSSLELLEGKS